MRYRQTYPAPCMTLNHASAAVPSCVRALRLVLGTALAATLMLGTAVAPAQTATGQAQPDATAAGGPVRLRQPVQAAAPGPAPTARGLAGAPGERATPDAPGEFEAYARRAAQISGVNGKNELLRFGARLLEPSPDSQAATEFAPVVPPDYLVQPGDELVVTIWGSVDADLRLQVDKAGRITVPRVGPVMVAGTRYGDLVDVISRRVGLVFKNFQLSATMGQLRGMPIYVTGFVDRPGPLVVSSLATLSQALVRAGGPSAAGSFRDVQLKRKGKVISRFDLYDLLLRGERANDVPLQPDDIVHVGPVGPQVAVIGSVNQPAIFELRPGETIAQVLQMAGGLSAVADARRIAIERVEDRATVRVTQIDLPQGESTVLRNGDLLRVFNAIDLAAPSQLQNKRVRVEGEVVRPGEYVLPANSNLADAVRAAGGPTANAFLYGAEFTRESVRVTQQQNYERALRDLETDLSRKGTSQRTGTADELAAQTAMARATERFIDRLRAIRPTGRVVLQVPPDGTQLPEILLEDGDRLYLPPVPTAVGVFGSVFNSGSFLYDRSRAVEDYLRLAGGPTRGADEDSVFLVRANGTVVSALQSKNWWHRNRELLSTPVLPGDTVFVPEDNDKYAFMQITKDWTQIFFQIGVGLAGMKTAIGL